MEKQPARTVSRKLNSREFDEVVARCQGALGRLGEHCGDREALAMVDVLRQVEERLRIYVKGRHGNPTKNFDVVLHRIGVSATDLARLVLTATKEHPKLFVRPEGGGLLDGEREWIALLSENPSCDIRRLKGHAADFYEPTLAAIPNLKAPDWTARKDAKNFFREVGNEVFDQIIEFYPGSVDSCGDGRLPTVFDYIGKNTQWVRPELEESAWANFRPQSASQEACRNFHLMMRYALYLSRSPAVERARFQRNWSELRRLDRWKAMETRVSETMLQAWDEENRRFVDTMFRDRPPLQWQDSHASMPADPPKGKDAPFTAFGRCVDQAVEQILGKDSQIAWKDRPLAGAFVESDVNEIIVKFSSDN